MKVVSSRSEATGRTSRPVRAGGDAASSPKVLVDALEEVGGSVERFLRDLVEKRCLGSKQVRGRSKVRKMPKAVLVEMGLDALRDPWVALGEFRNAVFPASFFPTRHVTPSMRTHPESSMLL